jgi:hypothetical protein
MKKILLILLANSVLGCGFFENDGNFIDTDVAGKIKIRESEEGKDARLIFKYNPENAMVIINHLGKASYDTKTKELFAEEIINTYNTEYHIVKILQPNANESYSAFTDIKVTKTEFNKALGNCLDCTIKYSNKEKK